MDFLHIIVLALIQGLTEFLPVSSSAHLILVPELLGWADQGLAFDVSAHVGTLCAVVGYFRADIQRIIKDWCGSLGGAPKTADSRLGWAVIFGTVPAVVAGYTVNKYGVSVLRDPVVIAIATVVFGVLLLWADKIGTRSRDERDLSIADVLFIGVAQTFALIPGTSRSGVTITAGLLLGLTREGAARFSFLLAIPLIVAAGSLKTLDVLSGAIHTSWSALGTGAVLSGISAYACIHLFLKLINRIGMMPFVIYRLILGAVIFLFVI